MCLSLGGAQYVNEELIIWTEVSAENFLPQIDKTKATPLNNPDIR